MSLIRHHSLLVRRYEPEVVSAWSRMTTKPNIFDLQAYDTFIKEIKIGHSLPLAVSSLYPTFRLLQIGACHHKQVATLNWASTGIDGQERSSYQVAGIGVTHTPYKYCSSVSATGHIAFTAGTWLDAYRLNMTLGLYAYNDPGTIYTMGGALTNGAANGFMFRSQTVNTNVQVRINGSSTGTGTQAINSPGIYAAKRNGNALTGWYNTTLKVTNNSPGDLGALVTPSVDFGIHGECRNGDVVGCNTTAQLSMHFYGTFAINLSVMKSAIENYLSKYP